MLDCDFVRGHYFQQTMPSNGCSETSTTSSNRTPKSVTVENGTDANSGPGNILDSGHMRSNSEKRGTEYLGNGVNEMTDDEVFVVNWDGPSDPSNPKKYALYLVS